MVELEPGKQYINRKGEILRAVEYNRHLVRVKIIKNQMNPYIKSYLISKNGVRESEYFNDTFSSFNEIREKFNHPQDIIGEADKENYPEYFI
jgi:hypothetical protein